MARRGNRRRAVIARNRSKEFARDIACEATLVGHHLAPFAAFGLLAAANVTQHGAIVVSSEPGGIERCGSVDIEVPTG
jgi:hypothetical protein